SKASLKYAVAAQDQDLYSILGVSPSADGKELKKAYRKLALKYHPDVNKQADAAQQFQKIKLAYSTLSDPKSRADYDLRRGAASRGSAGGRSGRTDDFDFNFDFDFGAGSKEEPFYGFDDFFKDMEKEFADYQAKSTGKPKSLWEELSDLGEEFVEFLEETVEEGAKEADAAQKEAENFRQAAEREAAKARATASTSEKKGWKDHCIHFSPEEMGVGGERWVKTRYVLWANII
ncbi:hypothetical protein CYMTET_21236, partial [Cymbomonas tetramitiformis]